MSTLVPELAEGSSLPATEVSRHPQISRPLALVGFAEALAAPEAVWSLVDEGFEVVAFARKGRASALRHSRHVVCHEICSPESDLQAACSDLRALVGSLNRGEKVPRLLLPLDDMAVWLGNQLLPEAGWRLAGPQGASADLALNKYLQTEAARAAGFNVPQTVLARSAEDLFAFSRAASFPIILKPAECVPVCQGRICSCRKWICANHKELESAVAAWGGRVPLLAQSFLTGTGEGIFGLAAPDGIRAWSAHRRLRMMNPQGSGSSACVSQAVGPEERQAAERFIRQAGWQGLFMIETLREPSGKLWFMELNGRTWGSMALCRRQGLEYPAWHARLALDPQSPVGIGSVATPGMVCRNLGREFMHLLFVLRGPRSKAQPGWPSIWKTLGEVGRMRRGDTFYNWRPGDARVFFADFYHTLQSNLLKKVRH